MLRMRLLDKLRYAFRWRLWSRRFGSVNGYVHIGENVTFQNPDTLHFGKGVQIGKHSYFLPLKQFRGVRYHPSIIIGDNCWIGIRNSFAAIDCIEIGKNVLFAGYVHITDHSHGYEDPNIPISQQTLISKGPVIIEDQCWLGFGSEVLSGVHIGRHSVVAARAVVTKDVPPFCVVAGNPAKIIKKYSFETSRWERVREL